MRTVLLLTALFFFTMHPCESSGPGGWGFDYLGYAISILDEYVLSQPKVERHEIDPGKLIVFKDQDGIVHEVHEARAQFAAAYFKHFRQEGKSNEVIVYFDKHGQPIKSVLVTPEMTEEYHHFLEHIDDTCVPQEATRKKAEGYIVSYTKDRDIIRVRKHSKEKLHIPDMKKTEINRFHIEALLVAHSSAYDRRTIKALEKLRKSLLGKEIVSP